MDLCKIFDKYHVFSQSEGSFPKTLFQIRVFCGFYLNLEHKNMGCVVFNIQQIGLASPLSLTLRVALQQNFSAFVFLELHLFKLWVRKGKKNSRKHVTKSFLRRREHQLHLHHQTPGCINVISYKRSSDLRQKFSWPRVAIWTTLQPPIDVC